MRSTFSGFEASKSALFTSQKSLDIVGNNLANITTEGYTRQRADQDSVTIAGHQGRLKQTQVNVCAMGTTLNGVSQLRDKRLDAAFRTEYSETGYFNQNSTMLKEMENVLQELDQGKDGNGYGLSYYVKQMYTALESMTNNANGATSANVFANAVSNITMSLNKMSESLTESASHYKTDLKTNVTEVNTMLSKVANLNKSIRECIVGGGYTEQYGPNELQDQRNLLLDQLAAFGEISVQDQSDGTVTVKMNGHTAVEGTECDRINVQDNTNGTLQLFWKTNAANAASGQGSLKATVDVLNGRGTNAISSTESTENGYLYYQDKLNSFASELAEVLNHTIPNEVDPEGKVISYRKLVGQNQLDADGNYRVHPDMLVTADKVSISDALLQDSSYVIYDKQSTDNSYILQLIDKLSIQDRTFSTGTETFSGTFQEYVANYTSTLGSDTSYYTTRYEASYSMVSEYLENRESVSGVSETEETVNMMTFNKAFQAAARMMTVMDDMLDVIINQMAV